MGSQTYTDDKSEVKQPKKGSFKVKKFGRLFVIAFDEEQRTVRAIYKETNWREGEVTIKTIAKCAPEDKFTVEFGAALALKRAMAIINGKHISNMRQELKAALHIKQTDNVACILKLEKIAKKKGLQYGEDG